MYMIVHVCICMCNEKISNMNTVDMAASVSLLPNKLQQLHSPRGTNDGSHASLHPATAAKRRCWRVGHIPPQPDQRNKPRNDWEALGTGLNILNQGGFKRAMKCREHWKNLAKAVKYSKANPWEASSSRSSPWAIEFTWALERYPFKPFGSLWHHSLVKDLQKLLPSLKLMWNPELAMFGHALSKCHNLRAVWL